MKTEIDMGMLKQDILRVIDAGAAFLTEGAARHKYERDAREIQGAERAKVIIDRVIADHAQERSQAEANPLRMTRNDGHDRSCGKGDVR